ncbi:MAG: GNAT family N-acetyltransferase [Candidatus Izemoplasma sp.]|nr:GNAT family N-acetyltransferase [Candidatus Izemoplasma sp.]
MDIKTGGNRFYIGDNEQEAIAEITFKYSEPSVIIINHTFVSPELRGQGIAGKLLNKVIDMAREKDLTIVPLCSYAARKMIDNPKYEDLLKKE